MRVAVLGLGSAGRRHARVAEALGHDVVGFDPAGGGTSASADAAVEAADAVIVASPNVLHAEHAELALVAGRPVLVEKPLAVTAAEAAELAAHAARAGVVAGVAMNWRFHPVVVALRELLDAGALGDVHFARASFGYDLRRWRPGTDYRASYSARADLGGGIVLDAIHELDYLLWLLGPATSVVAEAGHVSALELDVEDLAVAAVRFASGATAAVDLNCFEPVYRRGVLVAGSDAVASWDWGTGRLDVRRKDAPQREVAVDEDLGPTYRAVVEDFLACAAAGAEPRCPPGAGAAAVALAEALKDSARDGRRITLG